MEAGQDTAFKNFNERAIVAISIPRVSRVSSQRVTRRNDRVCGENLPASARNARDGFSHENFSPRFRKWTFRPRRDNTRSVSISRAVHSIAWVPIVGGG